MRYCCFVTAACNSVDDIMRPLLTVPVQLPWREACRRGRGEKGEMRYCYLQWC